MKLTFIAPSSMLKVLDEYQDFYLLLAHIAKEDKKYRDFFIKSNKYKVMDNSAHELRVPFDWQETIDLSEELKCQEIVLPDHPYNAYRTLQDSEKALKKLKGHKFRVMAVLQGSNLKEYNECLATMSSWEQVNVLGLSFRVAAKCFAEVTGDKEVMQNRITAIGDLVSRFGTQPPYNKEIHLLGLGDVYELGSYVGLPWIRGCDTTKQVRYGLKGIEFENGHCPDKVEGRLDFSVSEYSARTMKIITSNIRETKRVAEGKYRSQVGQVSV